MRKLSKIEDKVNRLIDRCKRLEAELNQGVLDFSADATNQKMEEELAMLRQQLAGKDNKLKQITSKMEKLQGLVKRL